MSTKVVTISTLILSLLSDFCHNFNCFKRKQYIIDLIPRYDEQLNQRWCLNMISVLL